MTIDGHHRFNAVRLNTLSGYSAVLKAWIVPTSHCHIAPVHRIVRVDVASKNAILSNLAIKDSQASSSPCLNFSSKRGVGLFDGREWFNFPDFGGSLCDNLYELHQICMNQVATIEHCTNIVKLIKYEKEARDGDILIFTFPAFDFTEIMDLVKKGRLLPAFSTYISPKPLESVLDYSFIYSELTPCSRNTKL